MVKMVKIDDFPKNAQNHPDFVPGKFGGPKPVERRSFRPQNAKKKKLNGDYLKMRGVSQTQKNLELSNNERCGDRDTLVP